MSAELSKFHPLELIWISTLYAPTEGEASLIEKLNINFPTKLPHDEKVDLGKIYVEGGSWVEISVVAIPARLYEFLVYNQAKDTTFRIRTGGTGDVRNYWKIVEAALLDKLHLLKPKQWIENNHYYQIDIIEKDSRDESTGD